MKKFIVLIIVTAIANSLQAQYFSWGNERGSTKWQQIETEHFQVIYPLGCDSVAQRFTQILQHVYSAVGKTLEHSPAKISVLLHTQASISNASVAWAPKRIDAFDVVSPTQTPDDWWEHIAIHEFRHVVQMDKLNEGATRILSLLLGEQAPSAVAGLYLPAWFMEGDAVVAETALGAAGRGRTADFSMRLRAQLAQKKQFSYAKAYFGSYCDFVPNEYEMGYVVVANTRSLFNPNVFAKVSENIAHHPFSVRPFDKGLRAQTGLNKLDLYDTTFKIQAQEWQLLCEREIQKPFDTIIFPAKKGYVDYKFATQINENQLLAERSGLANRRQLVLINKQKKRNKVIANTSFKPENEAFSTNNQYVVWAETRSDIRWELTNSTYIYMYSFETKKKKKIHSDKRLFAPAISPNSNTIVAVEIEKTSAYNLVFYTIASKEWHSIPLPQGEYALAPTWNTDGSKIAYIGVSSKGKRLVEYNVITHSFNEILPHTLEDLRSPAYYKSYILYSSSYSGVDNVYAVHSENKQQWRVTVSEFGAQFPRVYGDKITFNDYHANGFFVGSLPAIPHRWHSKNAVRAYSYPLATSLSWQENSALNFAKMPDPTFASRKYSKLAHLFKFHSWSPFYLSYSQNTTDFGIGAQIISQNILATAIAQFGYRATFDSAPLNVGFASFRYSGFFPIIDFKIEAGRQQIKYRNLSERDFSIVNSDATISLPFKFSRNGYSRLVVIGAQLAHSYKKPQFITDVANFSSVECKYTAIFSNMSSKAPRDLYSPWGQRFEISYLHNPYNSNSQASDYVYSKVDFYFPSIFKNHSIHGAAAFDWHKNETALLFNQKIFVPRGCEDEIFQRKDMFSSRLEYSLPLCYPDIAWRAVFYFKQLWTTVFFDYARTNVITPSDKTITQAKHYNSYGFDLNAELHLFHFRAPITVGMRSAYVPQTNHLSVLTLLSINLGAI